MLLLLPPFITGDKGFAAMVNRLNSTTLTHAINDMWRTEVEISIPKFTLEESVGNELISVSTNAAYSLVDVSSRVDGRHYIQHSERATWEETSLVSFFSSFYGYEQLFKVYALGCSKL